MEMPRGVRGDGREQAGGYAEAAQSVGDVGRRAARVFHSVVVTW